MKKYLLLIILPVILLRGCQQSYRSADEDANDPRTNSIRVSGTKFIDSYGRQVIFSGINKVNKNAGMNYIDNDSVDIYKEFTSWGFNCVRLGVIWAGVEPEPGKYDEKYLDKLEERVSWASQNGLYVLLDMHQDLFSARFSDGAPEWATITDNQPHETGSIWSDSYFISPAVQKAFDNFWANTKASDNVGIQDHYAKMWKHVAQRFANNKSVIGFDIMNEPFNGSQGTYILPMILTEYARLYAEETDKVLSQSEVMEVWANEASRFEALARMQNAEKYTRVLDVAKELNQQFEKNNLQPMYQNVGNAIREVDSTHILFIEHSYFGNTGILSSIEPVKKKSGENDPLVSYAAHGYDLLVDTKNYDSQSNSRVEVIFSRINETSRRMNVPVLVGEWGAFSGNSGSMAANAYFILKLFEKFSFSNTYWAYYTGIDKQLFFNSVIIRPYPPFISGDLVSYSFNAQTGSFSCVWKESRSVNAPTVIYIPDLQNLETESISIKPQGSKTVILPIKKSKAGYLIIPVSGVSGERSIDFKLTHNMASYSIESRNDN